MKKTSCLLTMLLLLGAHGYSQGKFSLHLDIAPTLSDFKQGTLNDLGSNASISFGDPKGFAGTGIGIGIEYLHPIKDKGIHLFLGLDAYRNGMRSIIKRSFNAQLGEKETIRFSNYYNIPITLGLHYEKSVTENLALYGQLGVLYDFLKITRLEHSHESGVVLKTTDQRYELSQAFGFAFEAGMVFNQKYSVSIGYKKLGSHIINNTRDQKYYYEGEIQEENSFHGFYTGNDQKNIMILNLSLGVRF